MKTLTATSSKALPGVDRLAIGLSGLCAVHCLATAVAVGLVSSVAGVLHAPIIHEVGLLVAMILGALALVHGVRRHGARLPIAIGVLGLATMAAALSLPHGWSGETVCTLLGVTLLGSAHLLNRRAYR